MAAVGLQVDLPDLGSLWKPWLHKGVVCLARLGAVGCPHLFQGSCHFPSLGGLLLNWFVPSAVQERRLPHYSLSAGLLL